MTLPKSTREGRCQFHQWLSFPDNSPMQQCATCGKLRPRPIADKTVTKPKPIKKGKGFAASKAQREKVAERPCVVCAAGRTDPAHLIPRGMGGCDEALCVVPLCRRCHDELDRWHTLDLLPFLEPRWRDEVAHAVQHVGLENARVRLAPSQYRTKEAA